jgi:hypothetical protein
MFDSAKFRIYSSETGIVVFDRYAPHTRSGILLSQTDLLINKTGTLIPVEKYVKDAYVTTFSLWKTIETSDKIETIDTGEQVDVYENDIIKLGYYTGIVVNATTFEYYKDGIQQTMNLFYKGDLPCFMGVIGNAHELPDYMELISVQEEKQWKKVDFIDWTNVNISHITDFDAIGYTIDSAFKSHMIKQELEMFGSLGRQVTLEELLFISNRRGFNINDINFIIKLLKREGLTDIEYITEHPSRK